MPNAKSKKLVCFLRIMNHCCVMRRILKAVVCVIIVNCTVAILNDCKSGQSCTFLSRVDGWQLYEELPSHLLTYPPRSKSWQDPSTTLYLTMSSYRDKLCPITLYNLFTKAAHPNRITVGVVQQNGESDVDCHDQYCELMKADKRYGNNWTGCPHSDQIRMNRLDAAEAKGPTWARAKGSQMLKDEEFCMQTDSHMDFVHHWDMHMMEMWAATNNEYGILSTYVADSATLKDNEEGQKGISGAFEVPHLCMVTLGGSHGMVRNWGTKCMRNMPKPKLTNAIWGAGLSFSKCHAEKKARLRVPYDPYTPHIFDGEEYSRAARFWTWGYDIYTPHRVFVVHNYKGSQSDPTHSGWGAASKVQPQEQKVEETRASVLRLKRLLEMPHEANNISLTRAVQRGRYGLGDRRTLDQLIQFSGIDTRNRLILPENRCGNIDFIPFTEHPLGPDYEPLYDPATESFVDARDPGSVFFDPLNAEMVIHWSTRLAAEKKKQQEITAPRVIDTVSDADANTADNKDSEGELLLLLSNPESTPRKKHGGFVHYKPVSAETISTKDMWNMLVMCVVCVVLGTLGRFLYVRRFQINKMMTSYMYGQAEEDSCGEENSAIKSV